MAECIENKELQLPAGKGLASLRYTVECLGKTPVTQVVIELKTFLVFFNLIKRSSGASQLSQLVLLGADQGGG